MDRIKLCQETFASLFGGTPNSGEGTDPEFMQILQRYIFGELSHTGTLNDQDRELVTITVLATLGQLPQLQAHVGACLHVGIKPLAIREAIYHLAPFIGFPKTLNAISAMNAAFAERGISLPLEDASTVNEEDRLQKGKAIQEPIYGIEIKDRYGYLPSQFDEAVPRFLSELCFGDFATRKGLDVKRREILILVCLAALGGADLQVKAHFLGARKAGNSDEELVCALVHASSYMGIPRLFNALNAVSDLLKENKEK